MDINEKLIDIGAVNHGDYWIVRCPICGKRESYIYLDDVEKHKKSKSHKIPIRCNRLNKCGKTSYIEDVDVSSVPKIKDDDIIGISAKGIERINDIAYLSQYLSGFDFDWRGISNQTLKENGVIYLKDGLISYMKNSGAGVFADKFFKDSYIDRNLIFPIKNYEGKCERLLLRSTLSHDEKYKKEIGMRLVKNSSEVWNRKDLINPDMPIIFVTEGVPDALSIKEVSQSNGAVALPGVRKYRQLIKEIQKSDIAKSKKYIICFDNDEAGAECIDKLATEMKTLGIQYAFFNLRKYKDLNEFLQGNRTLFFKQVNKITHLTKTYKFTKSKEKKEGKQDESKGNIEKQKKLRLVRKKSKEHVQKS